jgi:DNA-directed RNA polymerase specialized sigma24 family protein
MGSKAFSLFSSRVESPRRAEMKEKLRLKFYLTDSLVRDTLKGDQRATEDNIHENCLMYLSREDAGDVAQEILLAICKSGVASGSYASTICRDKIITALIVSMLEGDEHAASVLGDLIYRECWARFSRWAYLSREDAEDVSQEVLLAICKSGVASGSYASNICRNKIVDARHEGTRESQRRANVSSDEDTEQARENAICPPVQLEYMIEQETLKRKDRIQQKVLDDIQEIGDSLPAGTLRKQWQALSYQLDGLTLKQIRVKMGANSVGTVKCWISRYRRVYLEPQLLKRGWSLEDLRLAMGY